MIGCSLHSYPNPSKHNPKYQSTQHLLGTYPNEQLSSTISRKSEWTPLKAPYALNNLNSESPSTAHENFPATINPGPFKCPLSTAAVAMNLHKARDSIVKELGSRGVHGLFSFLRTLRRGNYYGDLSQPKFERAFAEHRIPVSKPALLLFFKELDVRHRCLISTEKFIELLKMRLSSSTLDLLKFVYQTFKSGTSSTVQASVIRQHYQPDSHPDVLSGKKTSAASLVEFLDSFDWDGETTFSDFQTYYELVRLTCASEEELTQVLNQCWTSQPTTSLPVLTCSTLSNTGSRSTPSPTNNFPIQTLGAPNPTETKPRALSSYGPSSSSSSSSSSSTSASYDPSVQFSLSSPLSIGVHEDTKSVVSATPSTSKPILQLLQSYFSWTRPLPYLRQLLLRQGLDSISWEHLVHALEGICPLEYLQKLWAELATTSTTLPVHELIQKLRLRELNSVRQKVIDQAYQKLDIDNRGEVSLERMKKLYRPLVAFKQKSNSNDFSVRDISQFFKGPIVTKEEFCTYYADVGSSIEDDNFFILMLWNEWGLSNTSPPHDN